MLCPHTRDAARDGRGREAIMVHIYSVYS
jgi:hypothetical protein